MTPESGKIYVGDCLEVIRSWPDSFIQCCMTSPPYWGLRDYGVKGQLGLEKTPDEYVAKMVEIFREVRRVLRDDGTLWLNLGDSYAGSWGNSGKRPELDGESDGQRPKHCEYLSRGGWDNRRERPASSYKIPGLKPKDLVGIPWMVAFALRADGWYLRSDIIWSKPNPMPESVQDRPTKSHEYIFLLTKSERYYYDVEAIKEPGTLDTHRMTRQERVLSGHKSLPTHERNGIRSRTDKQRGHSRRHAGFNDRWDSMSKQEQCSLMRNKRSVWTVPTEPFNGAHFATFPTKLIAPCILAGCPTNGIVLDPFMGSGTVALVALQYGRNFVGIELNLEYVKMAEKRIANERAQLKMGF